MKEADFSSYRTNGVKRHLILAKIHFPLFIRDFLTLPVDESEYDEFLEGLSVDELFDTSVYIQNLCDYISTCQQFIQRDYDDEEIRFLLKHQATELIMVKICNNDKKLIGQLLKGSIDYYNISQDTYLSLVEIIIEQSTDSLVFRSCTDTLNELKTLSSSSKDQVDIQKIQDKIDQKTPQPEIVAPNSSLCAEVSRQEIFLFIDQVFSVLLRQVKAGLPNDSDLFLLRSILTNLMTDKRISEDKKNFLTAIFASVNVHLFISNSVSRFFHHSIHATIMTSALSESGVNEKDNPIYWNYLLSKFNDPSMVDQIEKIKDINVYGLPIHLFISPIVKFEFLFKWFNFAQGIVTSTISQESSFNIFYFPLNEFERIAFLMHLLIEAQPIDRKERRSHQLLSMLLFCLPKKYFIRETAAHIMLQALPRSSQLRQSLIMMTPLLCQEAGLAEDPLDTFMISGVQAHFLTDVRFRLVFMQHYINATMLKKNQSREKLAGNQSVFLRKLLKCAIDAVPDKAHLNTSRELFDSTDICWRIKIFIQRVIIWLNMPDAEVQAIQAVFKDYGIDEFLNQVFSNDLLLQSKEPPLEEEDFYSDWLKSHFEKIEQHVPPFIRQFLMIRELGYEQFLAKLPTKAFDVSFYLLENPVLFFEHINQHASKINLVDEDIRFLLKHQHTHLIAQKVLDTTQQRQQRQVIQLVVNNFTKYYQFLDQKTAYLDLIKLTLSQCDAKAKSDIELLDILLADLYTIRVDLTLNQDISLFDEIKETILDKKYSQQGLAWLTSFAENVFADNEKQMRPIKPIQISPLDDPTIRKQINEEKKLSLKLFNETVEAQEREKQLKRKDAEQEKEFQDLTVSLAGSLVKTVLKKEVKNEENYIKSRNQLEEAKKAKEKESQEKELWQMHREETYQQKVAELIRKEQLDKEREENRKIRKENEDKKEAERQEKLKLYSRVEANPSADFPSLQESQAELASHKPVMSVSEVPHNQPSPPFSPLKEEQLTVSQEPIEHIANFQEWLNECVVHEPVETLSNENNAGIVFDLPLSEPHLFLPIPKNCHSDRSMNVEPNGFYEKTFQMSVESNWEVFNLSTVLNDIAMVMDCLHENSVKKSVVFGSAITDLIDGFDYPYEWKIATERSVEDLITIFKDVEIITIDDENQVIKIKCHSGRLVTIYSLEAITLYLLNELIKVQDLTSGLFLWRKRDQWCLQDTIIVCADGTQISVLSNIFYKRVNTANIAQLIPVLFVHHPEKSSVIVEELPEGKTVLLNYLHDMIKDIYYQLKHRPAIHANPKQYFEMVSKSSYLLVWYCKLAGNGFFDAIIDIDIGNIPLPLILSTENNDIMKLEGYWQERYKRFIEPIRRWYEEACALLENLNAIIHTNERIAYQDDYAQLSSAFPEVYQSLSTAQDKSLFKALMHDLTTCLELLKLKNQIEMLKTNFTLQKDVLEDIRPIQKSLQCLLKYIRENEGGSQWGIIDSHYEQCQVKFCALLNKEVDKFILRVEKLDKKYERLNASIGLNGMSLITIASKVAALKKTYNQLQSWYSELAEPKNQVATKNLQSLFTKINSLNERVVKYCPPVPQTSFLGIKAAQKPPISQNEPIVTGIVYKK